MSGNYVKSRSLRKSRAVGRILPCKKSRAERTVSRDSDAVAPANIVHRVVDAAHRHIVDVLQKTKSCRAQLRLQRERRSAWVALYRALGGGGTGAEPPVQPLASEVSAPFTPAAITAP